MVILCINAKIYILVRRKELKGMSKNKYKKKVNDLDVEATQEKVTQEKITQEKELVENGVKPNSEIETKESVEETETDLDEAVEKSETTVDNDDFEEEEETEIETDLETEESKSTDEFLVEIEKLKKSNETLASENKALKSELSTKEQQFNQSLQEVQINNAVEIAIREANGKNVKAIKALINFDEISLDENCEVTGLDEQIEVLKTLESSSFLFDENELVLKGVTPVSSAKASGISVTDFQKMSYKERLELYNEDASLYKTLKY